MEGLASDDNQPGQDHCKGWKIICKSWTGKLYQKIHIVCVTKDIGVTPAASSKSNTILES